MESKKVQNGPDTAPYSKTGLRQRDEHSTLKEVVLGSTTAAAYPPKSRATANFTDHIPYLKGGFYDQFEDGELIPMDKHAPEIVEAYKKLHQDLKEAYEREGVKVHFIDEPTDELLNYFGWTSVGYWPVTLASLYQVYGDVLVETIVSDNILETAIAGFAARDIYREKWKNDPSVVWLSMPASKPYDKVLDNSDTSFIMHGDIRMLDEKNILVGVGVVEGQKNPTASNHEGAEQFKRIMEKFGFNVHIVEYDGNIAFHLDYILGNIAPKTCSLIEGSFPKGLPEIMKDWDIIWIPREECDQGGANLVSLGPDETGQYRVMTPKKDKTPVLHAGLEKRGIRAIEIECSLPASTGGAIRCATLVLNRENNPVT